MSDMDVNNSHHLHGNGTDNSFLFVNQVLPVLYVLICVAGFILNGCAAWIFFRVPSTSALVVYLKNMMVADLLMLMSFPWKVASDLDLGGRPMKVLVCRYTAVFFYLSMYGGILFMGLISVERYVKIVHSSAVLASSSSSSRTFCSWTSSPACLLQQVPCARGLAVLVWLLLQVCMLPNSILSNQSLDPTRPWRCMALKSHLGLVWHQASSLFSVSLFWATLLLLAFCYTSISRRIYFSYRRTSRDGGQQAHRKSNRSIFSLLAVFFVCFVPYHVCRIPYTFSQNGAIALSPAAHAVLYQLKEGTLFLSALNVCLDPIIYFLMCRTFRESLLLKLNAAAAAEQSRQSLSNLG
ncbi:P2Y purinoceptor 14 [Denticeps clupeoides]|uniref:P2Y purinoceptor 14 n=1 Tax=Denticeps clupeoides TaxID=299321 RepID=UPI0010A2C246|nr:P2Y purinoceptor 14-like [Denticeps clupeoides]